MSLFSLLLLIWIRSQSDNSKLDLEFHREKNKDANFYQISEYLLALSNGCMSLPCLEAVYDIKANRKTSESECCFQNAPE